MRTSLFSVPEFPPGPFGGNNDFSAVHECRTVNTLVETGDRRWRLPRHAHIVVYERDVGGLLTIYDCGAAQKPPSAQLLGTLDDIEARHEATENPTGRVVRMREESTLVADGERRFRISA